MSSDTLPAATPRLADQAARDAIRNDLDVNLLVEASAGSGKTQSLAERMTSGILSGVYGVEGMAAVTFTRKAAAELRGRFQQALEEALTRETDAARLERARRALQNLERLFAGTIHSFCARLLRERPVEAGVTPGFAELDEVEADRLRRQAWQDHVVRLRATQDPAWLALEEAGVKEERLAGAFVTVCAFDDAVFPGEDVAAPDAEEAWRRLEAFTAAINRLAPATIGHGVKCKALQKVRRMQAVWQVALRSSIADLAALLGLWESPPKVTKKWWAAADPDEARRLIEAFSSDVAAPWLTQWRAHLYGRAIAVLVGGREAFRAARQTLQGFNYDDLLMLTARMLRDHPEVRRDLQAKYRWLFVDEFQDTDPLQAEILVALARADDDPGTLRPGALFIVGDPKQSIYRFRRADIEIYGRVRALVLGSGGRVERLVTCFRAAPTLCAWVNDVFAGEFPGEPTPQAPTYVPLAPNPAWRGGGKGAGVGVGVSKLCLPATAKGDQAERTEADLVARYIRTALDAGREPRDFLVLTLRRDALLALQSALEQHRIPVEVSGAGGFATSPPVVALVTVLRALAHPENQAALVGALRGPFFGVSDRALFAYRQAGGVFRLASVPDEATPAIAADPGAMAAFTALQALRHAWQLVRTLPVGAAVERVLDDTGWLAWSATLAPDGAEAGDVVHALDRIRRVTSDGGTLADAIDALDHDVELAEVESLPLEPGRSGVVRLMNLHKAKGLEATVVILAGCRKDLSGTPTVRVVRHGNQAVATMSIRERANFGWHVVAEPLSWPSDALAEQAFLDAEHTRLRYVAATRAREQLVVVEPADGDKHTWALFAPALSGTPLEELPASMAEPEPFAIDVSSAARATWRAERDARVAAVRAPSWSTTSVTGSTGAVVPVREDDVARLVRGPGGVDWGTLVHRLLELAVRRPAVDDTTLAGAARWFVAGDEELLPHVNAAVAAVRGVMASPMWADAMAAPERYAEVPFAICRPLDPASGVSTIDAVLHGVIDLVYRTPEGWAIVDFKTDVVTDGGEALVARYAPQLGAYADVWRALCGDREARVRTGLHLVRIGQTTWA